MAILFAFVAIWGSMAHACETTPHSHAGTFKSAIVSGDAATASAHDTQTPASERELDSKSHPCCADLQCCAGAAILTSGITAAPSLLEAEPFGIADRGRESSLLSSLDRPPRTTAQI
jgi:hypothetical protein